MKEPKQSDKPKLVTFEQIDYLMNTWDKKTEHFVDYVTQEYDIHHLIQYVGNRLYNNYDHRELKMAINQYNFDLEYIDKQPSVDKEFEQNVDLVLNSIKKMLLEKNRKYGDAALNPIGIFAKGSAASLINVRIDDKLNRIKNQQEDEDEDAEKDLLGYLVLKQITKQGK